MQLKPAAIETGGVVLILVLVEDGLRVFRGVHKRPQPAVLILVLVEDGLRALVFAITLNVFNVLILVLVEDGLRGLKCLRMKNRVRKRS